MNRDEFQSKVLELWKKSRIPLTRANLQFFAEVPDRTLSGWIRDLLHDGVLALHPEEHDEVEYIVPGAHRPIEAPETCEAYERKRVMVEEARRRILARRAGQPTEPPAPSPSALQKRPGRDSNGDSGKRSAVGTVSKVALTASSKALIALDKPLTMLDKPRGKGDKSLLASAGLSLFGPVGWLYAGSFREAIPATLGYVALGYMLPSFLFAPFLLLGMLASSAVGLTYAWQFNRKKGRTPLLLQDKKARGDNGDNKDDKKSP